MPGLKLLPRTTTGFLEFFRGPPPPPNSDCVDAVCSQVPMGLWSADDDLATFPVESSSVTLLGGSAVRGGGGGIVVLLLHDG